MAATDYLSKDEIRELGQVSSLRGVAGVVWTWAWIIGAWVLFALEPSVWTFALGWVVVSGRHLAIAILMHEAAHFLLVRDKKWNDRLGEWLVAYPAMLRVDIYRSIHFQHHRATWTDADPDVGLSRPFPITKRSFLRKVIRDLTGQTGYQRYKQIARLSMGLSPMGKGLEGKSLREATRNFLREQRGFVVTSIVLLAALTAAGHPEIFILLWWLPAFTGYSLVLRIRSIAEHAVVPDPTDELLQTRTTLAPFWVRFLMAPHHVNYHLEHHLFMFVPHYNLPRAHALLRERGVLDDASVAPGYVHVLKLATSAG